MPSPTYKQTTPLDDALDRILADIAIRIQLSQTAYEKAVQRYEAIADWLDRDGSPLQGRVELFYPQGSMAIGATIASRVTNDDYDLDMVLQAWCGGLTPKNVLDLLFQAINGQAGSRYYGMARRRTRCVTIEYADMHIDVTPAERQPSTPERESAIFHHKQPQGVGQRFIANPYGFAEWFKRKTPDDGFGEQYATLARAHEAALLVEAAEADPVPPPEPAFRKSLAVVALQLLKRWRNVQYQDRSGRKPPSIVMSKLVADAAGQTNTLSKEVLHQAKSMLAFFERSHSVGQRIRVANPVCASDVLTDRWPGTFGDQTRFVNDLRQLVRRLEQLADCDLGEMKEIMVELFGEGPTAKVIDEFVKRFGREIKRGKSRHERNSGRVVLPGAAAAGVSTPKRQFYGGKWWER